jgi:hypothetical protein
VSLYYDISKEFIMAILRGFPPSNTINPCIYIRPDPPKVKRWNHWLNRRIEKNPSICTRCLGRFLPSQVIKMEPWVCPLTNIKHVGQFCHKCDEERQQKTSA